MTPLFLDFDGDGEDKGGGLKLVFIPGSAAETR